MSQSINHKRNSGAAMKSTKTILWDYVVSRRINEITAMKERMEATELTADEKYDNWATAMQQKNEAEISWKEYNELNRVA